MSQWSWQTDTVTASCSVFTDNGKVSVESKQGTNLLVNPPEAVWAFIFYRFWLCIFLDTQWVLTVSGGSLSCLDYYYSHVEIFCFHIIAANCQRLKSWCLCSYFGHPVNVLYIASITLAKMNQSVYYSLYKHCYKKWKIFFKINKSRYERASRGLHYLFVRPSVDPTKSNHAFT